MTEKKEVDIGALFDQTDVVLGALRKAGLEAMRQYIYAGKSMISWKDGKVIEIPPEELKQMLAEAEAEDLERESKETTP